AQDVGASSVQPNPNAATITESFGYGSDSEAATEEEVEQKDGAKEKSADDVEDSQSEESLEKSVSLGEEDTESEKTIAEGQGTIDLDGFDSLEESQS
ncbi:hypothetical protein A2U01_0074963, partial [Trifolium medium]|nr:hypothetical protein [Trifolium medium]